MRCADNEGIRPGLIADVLRNWNAFLPFSRAHRPEILQALATKLIAFGRICFFAQEVIACFAGNALQFRIRDNADDVLKHAFRDPRLAFADLQSKQFQEQVWICFRVGPRLFRGHILLRRAKVPSPR